ncbi:MAG: PilW family protein [Gammaproteobacteria bacterium]
MTHTHTTQRGLSLIELLVAIAIGAVLIFGATQAYVDSRNAYGVNESVSRMQENGRYAMSVLEPDLRMSNYWGLQKGADIVSNKFKKTDGQASFAGAAATSCGNNYGVDLENNIEGTDASYPTTVSTCLPLNNKAVKTADTVTVRRASTVDSTAAANFGSLRICSTRGGGILLADTSTSPLCAGVTATPKTAQINDLIVNLYYVDQDSAQQTGYPSLRRYWLDVNGSIGPKNTFQDAEIVAGIEDMQVEYGVDRTGGYGPSGGAAVQYLPAGTTLSGLLNAATNPAQIVSVRIWLLVRADAPEVGFTDERVYTYGSRSDIVNKTGDLNVLADASKSFQPSLNSNNTPTGLKHYRRVLISRTIQVRNALGT